MIETNNTDSFCFISCIKFCGFICWSDQNYLHNRSRIESYAKYSRHSALLSFVLLAGLEVLGNVFLCHNLFIFFKWFLFSYLKSYCYCASASYSWNKKKKTNINKNKNCKKPSYCFPKQLFSPTFFSVVLSMPQTRFLFYSLFCFVRFLLHCVVKFEGYFVGSQGRSY